MFNVGLNLVETNGKATPSLRGAATSVAGFLVNSQRGSINQLAMTNAATTTQIGNVVAVTSFAQFVECFGTFTSNSVGAYAVKGFFDNGGQMAYVSRVYYTPPAISPPPGAAASGPASHTFADTNNHGSFTLTAAYRGSVDPGAWANGTPYPAGGPANTPGKGLWVKIENNVYPAAGPFANLWRLTVYYGNRVVEIWDNLTMTGTVNGQSPTALNDPNTGSKYVRYDPAGTTSTPAAPTTGGLLDPAATAAIALLGGSDASSAPAAADYGGVGGYTVFDNFSVQLLAAPDVADGDWSAVTQGGRDYSANRGDCMFVGHLSGGGALPAQTAITTALPLRQDKSYCAVYHPYIKVIDPNGTGQLPLRAIPPEGHVMGVYARTAQNRGIWKAPAGVEANVIGAIDVSLPISDTDLTNMVVNGGVNGIRAVPGYGIIVDSSRTLSNNTLWLYVNVRLLFNYVKSTLKQGLRWTVQEPNDTTLWNKVKYGSITPFLMGLYRQGAFGPGKPTDVFTVVCDNTNNTSTSIANGYLNCEVYFYPSRPAETVVITVGQQDGGASAAES